MLSLPRHCHADSILANGVCLSEKIRKVVWGEETRGSRRFLAGSVADVVLAAIEVRKVAEGGHTHTRISAYMCPAVVSSEIGWDCHWGNKRGRDHSPGSGALCWQYEV